MHHSNELISEGVYRNIKVFNLKKNSSTTIHGNKFLNCY